MRRIPLSLALLLPAAAVLAQPAPRTAPNTPPHQDLQAPPKTPPNERVPDLDVLPDQNPTVPNAGANAQGGKPGQPAPRAANNRPAPKAPETDEQLLAKLAKAGDQREARPIERELRARWAHTDSPSANLLLKRIDEAAAKEDLDTAREIAGKLTTLAPKFAEAWHRRATLSARKDDYQDAIASMRQALTLQPKHFGVLAELGGMLEEFEDKTHALEAYRQAKALDPFIEGIDDRIRQLTKDVEGQGI